MQSRSRVDCKWRMKMLPNWECTTRSQPFQLALARQNTRQICQNITLHITTSPAIWGCYTPFFDKIAPAKHQRWSFDKFHSNTNFFTLLLSWQISRRSSSFHQHRLRSSTMYFDIRETQLQRRRCAKGGAKQETDWWRMEWKISPICGRVWASTLNKVARDL